MKSPTRVAGGKKAAKKQKELYGEDVFEIIGRAGGVVRNKKKGFGSNRELARIAGSRGGKVSRRGKTDLV